MEKKISVRRVEKMDLVEVDSLRIRHTIDAYFNWKQLDAQMRALATRGINFPSEISEGLACYALGYKMNKASGGDAYDPVRDLIIEMKGLSSENESSPSSFSPSENFDELVFIKLNKRDDYIDIYLTGVSSADVKLIMVNTKETFEEQQLKGRRPRFSIMDKIIKPAGMTPDVRFNMRTGEITDLK